MLAPGVDGISNPVHPAHGSFSFFFLPLQNLFGAEISWAHADLRSPSLLIFVELLAEIWIVDFNYNIERGWTVFPRTFLFFSSSSTELIWV